MSGAETPRAARLPSLPDLRTSVSALRCALRIVPVRADWLAVSGLLRLSAPLVGYAEIVIIGALVDRLALGTTVTAHVALVGALLGLLCLRPARSSAAQRGRLFQALSTQLVTNSQRCKAVGRAWQQVTRCGLGE